MPGERQRTNGIVSRVGGAVSRGVTSGTGIDGLRNWWKFDSGSGSTAKDYEGSNDGNISGATWVSDAKTGGYALDFDGVDDYVDHDTNAVSNLPITVTAWVKAPSNSNFNLIYNEDRTSSGDTFLDLRVNDNDGLEVLVRDSNGNLAALVDSGVIVTDGTWHFVSGVYGDSVVEGFVDASSVGTVDASAVGSASSNIASIGARRHLGKEQNHFDGIIDDVRVYDRALSQSEIQQIYDDTK